MTQSTFNIKGNVITISVIYLCSANLKVFEEQLKSTIASSQSLFENMPIIIDLSYFSNDSNDSNDSNGEINKEKINFKLLKRIISRTSLIIVGLRDVPVELRKAAKNENWSIISSVKKNKSTSAKVDEKAIEIDSSNEIQIPVIPVIPAIPAIPADQTSQRNPNENSKNNDVINTIKVNLPVRSGQQIYSQNNIVLLKNVSAGAEILACGDIHAYAPVFGKVLAGINGNRSAQIFLKCFNAELVSIAGFFKLFDQFPEEITNKSVRIYLDDDQIKTELLG